MTHNIMWNVGLNNADIQGNIVPGGHKILEGRMELWLNVARVVQRQVLLGQLQHQLPLSRLLSGSAEPRNLVARQAAHVVIDLQEGRVVNEGKKKSFRRIVKK